MQRKSLALKQLQATIAPVDTVVALREEVIKTQHFISLAANGILILFCCINKNHGSAEQRTYVNEATWVFFLQRPLMRLGLAEGIVVWLKC